MTEKMKLEKDHLLAVSTEKLHQLEEKVAHSEQSQHILEGQTMVDKKVIFCQILLSFAVNSNCKLQIVDSKENGKENRKVAGRRFEECSGQS